MQNIGEVDLPLIFVPLPVRISQRFVDTRNSSVRHLTTKMQKEVCEVFVGLGVIIDSSGIPIMPKVGLKFPMAKVGCKIGCGYIA
nr:hypothetical protein CFP56_23576 [Quercus suber]